MAIDREKYIVKYIDEGLENITLIECLVFDIRDGISIEDDLATLLRALHTLKGLSRMLEFRRIEELTHALESVFISLKEQRIGMSDNAVKLVLAALGLIRTGLGIVQRTKDDVIDIAEYVKKLVSLAANEEFTLPDDLSSDSSHGIVDFHKMAETPEHKQTPVSGTDVPAVKQQKEAKSDSIRLSLEKINGIIKSIASLQSLEVAAKSLSLESTALNILVKEFSEKLKANSPAMAVNFRKVERLSKKINSALRNYSLDAGNHIRNAYDTVISLRTLPLSTILDNYQRYVFQLAGEMGKKVQLVIEGKENEIDKNIIESLSEVFMHMVRNAVDHGLETPEERLTAGKSETGKVAIVCSRESHIMKIIISDDGRGIDHEKIRQKAVREGLVSESAAASLSREDLTNFIFQSGFSTSSSAGCVSGRGVGMDVVRESIEGMKGSIVVDSVYGKGTAFTVMVPLSIAALMGFPVVAGGMKFIIPATFVETVMLLNNNEITTVVDRPEMTYNGRLIKLYYLSRILQIKTDAAVPSDFFFVVIIRAYDDIAAIAVDDITSMKSVILKTMPGFIKNMPVFSGIVLNEYYEMVSVLHIPTVLKMAKRIKTIDLKKHNVEFERLRKSILVVDDSRSTREIERDILSAEGYLVDTAADGAEALKYAKNKRYDLVCTDINMPVMNGFMLIENIRKNKELSQIPVIVISSRESEEDQKHAAMLGASRYIVKNSFNNRDLLEAVRGLIGGEEGSSGR